MPRQEPKQPGYVCPTTGRVAVLVKDYADSDLNGDASAYWFNPEAEGWAWTLGNWSKAWTPTRKAVRWMFALPTVQARRSGR